MREKIIIYILGIIIFTIGIFGLFTSIYNKDFLNYFYNLSTESIGIIVTIFVIDYLYKLREQKEKEKKLSIALNGIYQTLQQHVQMLANMYKASVKRIDMDTYFDSRDLFNEDFFNQIKNLDFLGKVPLSIYNKSNPRNYEDTNWYYYLNYCLKPFKEDIGKNIEKYSYFYNSETLEILEKLINNSFLNLLSIYENEIMRDSNLPRDWIKENSKDIVNDYLEKLNKIIEIFNEYSQENKIVINKDLFSENMAPKIGGSRLNS